MFAIRLNGTILDLDPDASLALTLSCPLFDKDGAERVFSLPFSLPRSAHNEAALRHTARFDARRKSNVFSPAMLLVGGSEYETGELVVTGGNSEVIEVAFRNIPVGIFEDMALFKVNEVLETITVGQTGQGGFWKYSMQSYPSTYSISFEDAGIATYTPGGGEDIEIATLAFASQINNVVPGIVIGASGGVITLSAALVNEYPVIQTVALALDEYKSEGDDDYEDMADFIADIIATPDDRVAFPTIRWEGAYANKAPHYRHIMNNIADGVLQQNPEYTTDEDWKWGLLPLVRWPYVMGKIEEQAGITFAGDVWDETDIQALLILNNYTIDYVQRDRYPVSSTLSSEDFVYQNSFLQEIDLNDHVPPLTGADFVRGFMGIFALFVRYGDGYMKFFRKKDLVDAEPLEWTDYVSRDEYDHVVEVERGFTLDYTRRKEDKFEPAVPGQLDEYVSGDGEEKLFLPMHTINIENTTTETHGVLRIPHTEQKVETGYLGGKPSQYPLAFLIDRGLMTSSNTSEYPYATPDELDDSESPIGDYALTLKEEKGIFARWWDGVAGLDQRPALDIRVTLPLSEVFLLRRWETGRVRFFHPNGVVTLVIRSVEFTIPATGDSDRVTAKVRGVIE